MGGWLPGSVASLENVSTVYMRTSKATHRASRFGSVP